MSEGIPAIYDNGVFRPLGPVDLPDQAAVTVVPQRTPGAALAAMAGMLSPDGPNATDGEEFERTMQEILSWRRLPRGGDDSSATAS